MFYKGWQLKHWNTRDPVKTKQMPKIYYSTFLRLVNRVSIESEWMWCTCTRILSKLWKTRGRNSILRYCRIFGVDWVQVKCFLCCFCTARTVDQLLQLPMTGGEEETLVQFLTSSTDQYCQEVLILHYLQRACYVEAIRLNEKLKQTVMVSSYIYCLHKHK